MAVGHRQTRHDRQVRTVSAWCPHRVRMVSGQPAVSAANQTSARLPVLERIQLRCGQLQIIQKRVSHRLARLALRCP